MEISYNPVLIIGFSAVSIVCIISLCKYLKLCCYSEQYQVRTLGITPNNININSDNDIPPSYEESTSSLPRYS